MSGQQQVVVLGYGEMGHAMESLLKERHSLKIWQRHPGAGQTEVELEEVVRQSDLVIFCLPVVAHRDLARRIKSSLKRETICISIAKGLDQNGQTAAQIFADTFTADQAQAFIYGPMISEEIRAGHYAFAQVACEGNENYQRVKQLFQGSTLFTTHTSDIIGTSWSVVLKNVYALIFGMADELELGDNTRGFLAATALHELDQIARQMGGAKGSPYHLAGLGDLITTATSEASHHHELGRMLARGETKNLRGEGVNTLAMVNRFNLIEISHYPLFTLIDDIVRQPVNIVDKFEDYLRLRFE